MLSLPTTTTLLERLAIESLRRICGWETRREVPSEATFSRAFQEFAETELPERMHEALVKRTLGDCLVGCVARDTTEIEAREKPAAKDDPPPPSVDPPRQRGRSKKGEERPKEPTRLERQMSQSIKEMLAGSFQPIAISVAKRTARDTRKAGRATNSTSMSSMDKSRSAAYSPPLLSMIAKLPPPL